jgi:hypothetical protein
VLALRAERVEDTVEPAPSRRRESHDDPASARGVQLAANEPLLLDALKQLGDRALRKVEAALELVGRRCLAETARRPDHQEQQVAAHRQSVCARDVLAATLEPAQRLA